MTTELPGMTNPPSPAVTPRPAGTPSENGLQTATATLLTLALGAMAQHYGVPTEYVAPATVLASGLLGALGSFARHRLHAGAPLPASTVLTRVG